MTVPEAFLIFVDDILCLYSLASPYSCTGIKQLLQICIYTLFRAVTYLLELLKFICGIIAPGVAPGMQNQVKFRIFKIQGILVLGHFF
jgi:hypothetical protein